jgi:rare lipoprotein A
MNPLALRATVFAALITLCVPFASAQTPAPGKSPAPAANQAPAATPAPAASAQTAPSVQTGKLAWYGRKFTGRRTASGEAYNPDALTMAHKTLPFGTQVKVTNTSNKKSVTLRVNDRGPTQADRVGDVSLAAARQLGMVRAGVIDAELEVVGSAPAKQR